MKLIAINTLKTGMREIILRTGYRNQGVIIMIQLIYVVFDCPNCNHQHNPVKTESNNGGSQTTALLLSVQCENCHEDYTLGVQGMIAVIPKVKENLNFLHDINIIEDDEELEL